MAGDKQQKKPRSADWVDPRSARTTARIIELLASGPMTREGIANDLSVSNTTVHTFLNRLMAAPRKIHVCGWERTGGRAFRLFGLGDAPDAPFEPLRSISKPKVDMTEINCKVLADALARPQSADELAESCRCSPAYVRKYLAILMAEAPRRIHLHVWRRHEGRGPLTKVYAAGDKRDAPRPHLTASERFQELKANADKHERVLKLRCLAAARRRTRNKPQNVFSALGL
jgi:predicted ArsR family transcriptional regulator